MNWNTRELAAQAVASVLRWEDPSICEVIVVDNASTDGSEERLRAEFPSIRVIGSGGNLGFARGNNLGARVAVGEWLILLNSDAYLTAPVLPALLEAARTAGRPCVLTCRLTYPDGSAQPSAGTFPTLSGYLREALFLNGSRPVGVREAVGEQPLTVDWVSGALLAVPTETYMDLGGLEEGIFMYGEDLDFCRKAALAGLPRLLVPGVTAVHIMGGSQAPASPESLFRTDSGRLEYFRKWHGSGAAAALRVVFLLRSGLRTALFSLAAPVSKRMRRRAWTHFLGALHLLGGRHGRHSV